MPPKKRNKADTKKRKGKSKGVQRAPAAKARTEDVEAVEMLLTLASAKSLATTRATATMGALSVESESAATEQPQKKMRLAGIEDEERKEALAAAATAVAGGIKVTTGAKSSAMSSLSLAADEKMRPAESKSEATEQL